MMQQTLDQFAESLETKVTDLLKRCPIQLIQAGRGSSFPKPETILAQSIDKSSAANPQDSVTFARDHNSQLRFYGYFKGTQFIISFKDTNSWDLTIRRGDSEICRIIDKENPVVNMIRDAFLKAP